MCVYEFCNSPFVIFGGSTVGAVEVLQDRRGPFVATATSAGVAGAFGAAAVNGDGVLADGILGHEAQGVITAHQEAGLQVIETLDGRVGSQAGGLAPEVEVVIEGCIVPGVATPFLESLAVRGFQQILGNVAAELPQQDWGVARPTPASTMTGACSPRSKKARMT